MTNKVWENETQFSKTDAKEKEIFKFLKTQKFQTVSSQICSEMFSQQQKTELE